MDLRLILDPARIFSERPGWTFTWDDRILNDMAHVWSQISKATVAEGIIKAEELVLKRYDKREDIPPACKGFAPTEMAVQQRTIYCIGSALEYRTKKTTWYKFYPLRTWSVWRARVDVFHACESDKNQEDSITTIHVRVTLREFTPCGDDVAEFFSFDISTETISTAPETEAFAELIWSDLTTCPKRNDPLYTVTKCGRLISDLELIDWEKRRVAQSNMPPGEFDEEEYFTGESECSSDSECTEDIPLNRGHEQPEHHKEHHEQPKQETAGPSNPLEPHQMHPEPFNEDSEADEEPDLEDFLVPDDEVETISEGTGSSEQDELCSLTEDDPSVVTSSSGTQESDMEDAETSLGSPAGSAYGVAGTAQRETTTVFQSIDNTELADPWDVSNGYEATAKSTGRDQYTTPEFELEDDELRLDDWDSPDTSMSMQELSQQPTTHKHVSEMQLKVEPEILESNLMGVDGGMQPGVPAKRGTSASTITLGSQSRQDISTALELKPKYAVKLEWEKSERIEANDGFDSLEAGVRAVRSTIARLKKENAELRSSKRALEQENAELLGKKRQR